jgi:hypothetical protein
MKSIYFILAVIVLFAQSCTIQKRQYLPGYHIEWNMHESHSQVQSEKIQEQASDVGIQDIALVTEVGTQLLEQEVSANHSVAEVLPSTDLENEAPIVKGNQAAKIHSENHSKQRLTFPSFIHSPVQILFGGTTPEDRPRTDGLSIAAMICGIVGLFSPGAGIILSIVAIVFGAVGLGRTRRYSELRGRGMAVTGLVLGILGLLLSVFIVAFYASFLWY